MKSNPAGASAAYQTFLASMQLTYNDWHDGVGYDLEALENITQAERAAAIEMLAGRLATNPDWREVEALAALDSPPVRAALRQAVKQADFRTRLRAAESLAKLGETVDLDAVIVEALRGSDLSSGLSQAIDIAEQNPSPRIQETLLDLALNGNDDQRVQCAALALYLGGKADEAFDWNHRPFFLCFGEPDRKTQIAAYQELCQRLGVTPAVKA